MKTSQKGRAFIAAHEGVVLKAYRDVVGVLTIGVGHTARAGGLKPVPGMRITRAQAMDLLAADLKKFETRVNAARAFTAQAPFDGATSFDFNTGRIHNATWVTRYAAGAWTAAEVSLMQWVKAGGKTWPGLARRREAEADLIFRGRYSEAPKGLDAPAVSQFSDDTRAYQKQLRTLGFYTSAVDGLPGSKTREAVIAFQNSHPHLDADGIVGPATRAALTRAMNLRKRAAQTTAIAGGSGVAIGNADQAVDTAGDQLGGIDFTALGVGVGLVVLAVLGALTAWRYRDEIKHFLSKL